MLFIWPFTLCKDVAVGPGELSAMHKTDGLELRRCRATEGLLLSSETRLGMSAMLTVTTMRLESSGKMGVWG